MTDPLRPPDTDEEPWPANTLHTWANPDDPEYRLHRAVDETAIRAAWDKYHEPDDLAPARGCLLGIVGGLALWALLILLVVAAWKVTR